MDVAFDPKNSGGLMSRPLAIENRLQHRHRLLGSMPGQLCTRDKSREFYCRPLDVSPYGFGIFTDEQLDGFGRDFILVLANREIELQLVWSEENPGDRFGYRNGFKVIHASIDLEQVCRDYGYL